MITDDEQLLQAYARERSESAFGELVTRHIDFVYSTALRVVNGDSHLAQDVAQTVFIDLARKAGSLPGDVGPAGWLHHHTCYTAAKAVRTERRRETREQTAMEMRALDDNTRPEWELVAPYLDESLDQLNPADRDALVLRFLKQQDLRTVGEALGISDDAARKRVDRALEKLHVLLKHRGATLSAATLGTALATETMTAAPAGLAAAITTAALSGSAGTTTAVVAASKAIAMTTLQKTLVTATIIAIGGGAIYTARQATQLREQIQTLQQQQAPLNEQIQALRGQRDEAAQQLAALQASQPRDLLRLRNEVGLLRQQTNALARQLTNSHLSNAPNTQQLDPAANPIPCDSCTFSGYATPEAAMQTVAWALTKGDLGAYLDCLGPEGRDKVANEFQGKSEVEIFSMLRDKMHGAAALRLDRKKPLEDGAVAFPLHSVEDDNGLTINKRTAMIRFRNVGGEWRLASD